MFVKPSLEVAAKPALRFLQTQYYLSDGEASENVDSTGIFRSRGSFAEMHFEVQHASKETPKFAFISYPCRYKLYRHGCPPRSES